MVMKEFTHGSLFSGIGGFDLAAEWMGWKNTFHCEWNPFGQKVLKYYWPNAESFTDITKTDFRKYAIRIDILTGGFPCQPYSVAGKRLGKEDDRHLFPEMLRAIREIQPRFIVGENVSGLVNWNAGMVFNEVQADLEAEGYSVTPFLLPACAVNAPHRRDRVWFVAYNNNGNREKIRFQTGREIDVDSFKGKESFTYTYNARTNEQIGINPIGQEENKRWKEQSQFKFRKDGRNESTTNTYNGWSGRKGIEQSGSECKQQRSKVWSELTPGFKTNDWADFPTQSPICDGNDGLSSRLDSITFPKWRSESIKAGGNAIVPQVAYQIFKAIHEFENKQK